MSGFHIAMMVALGLVEIAAGLDCLITGRHGLPDKALGTDPH